MQHKDKTYDSINLIGSTNGSLILQKGIFFS